MPTMSSAPATARNLLAALTPSGPAVEGRELTLGAGPPADLEAALPVLQTGVRAILVAKKWYGCDSDTGRVSVVNPATEIPAGIGLLCVEGDRNWDRIHATARHGLPHLFASDDRPARR